MMNADFAKTNKSTFDATLFCANRGCSTISQTLLFEGVSGLHSIVVGTWLWRGSD
jgi:hypothetical protein